MMEFEKVIMIVAYSIFLSLSLSLSVCLSLSPLRKMQYVLGLEQHKIMKIDRAVKEKYSVT